MSSFSHQPKRTLSWLHLSDFHFGKGAAWQQQAVWDHLVCDVVEDRSQEDPPIDWVFLSGDIANWGIAKEYTIAQARFEELAKALNHNPKDHWFIAPGNHDVNRGLVSPLMKRMRNKLEIEDIDLILPDRAERAAHANRQDAFFKFASDFCGGDWSPENPWQVEIRDIAGIRVAVLCLNSAWLCQDDDDEGHIAMGWYQVQDALNKLKKHDVHLKIALFHHPLFDFMEEDAHKVEGLLTGSSGCQFIMRGHKHQTRLSLAHTPDQACFEMAAGAAWGETRHPLAITQVSMDLTANTLQVTVWAYSENNGGFWHPANHIYKGLKNGRYQTEIPSCWGLKPGLVSDGNETTGTTRVETLWIPTSYRKHLLSRYGSLEPLVDPDKPLDMRLRRVFAPLETDWQSAEEREAARKREQEAKEKKERDKEHPEKEGPPRRPLDKLLQREALQHCLIVGGPGSGKSTLLAYLALEQLEAEDSEAVLPIFLPLKKLGDFLKHAAAPEALQTLVAWAAAELTPFGIDSAALQAKMGSGRVWWLLDGLDEIFAPEQRIQAARLIGAFAHCLGERDRLTLTTRPVALSQAGVRVALPFEQKEAGVLPLDNSAQEKLLTRWFEAIKGEDALQEAHDLKQRLWGSLRQHPNVAAMCDNPLLLSVIAAIFNAGKAIPRRRIDLYHRAVNLLLERRFGPLAGGPEDECTRLSAGLAHAALWMHQNNKVRQIHELDLLERLKEKWFETDTVNHDQLVALRHKVRRLGAHSGLLRVDDDPPKYSFTHLGFQEFLAAVAASEKKQPFLFMKPHLTDTAWHEVVLLTAAYLCRTRGGGLGQVFLEGLYQRAQDYPGDIEPLTLAVEAAAEADLGNINLPFLERLRDQTASYLEDGNNRTTPKQRQRLGLALGVLGDPRLSLAKADRWVRIEPGTFMMGDNDLGEMDEKPAHRVTLTQPFLMAKYPVTNAEFRPFVQTKGYEQPRWWSEEGRMWRWRYQEWFQRFELDDQPWFKPGKEPGFWQNNRFNQPNQPVVGVSWYEAEAFCNWQSTLFNSEPPAGWPVGAELQLPTEAQWEYAARGEAGRRYAWPGENCSPAHANYSESGLSQPNVVGIYPRGKTPTDLFDLGGNVWAWCRDHYEARAYRQDERDRNPFVTREHAVRALRGGSWYGGARNLAASYRSWDRAGSRSSRVGFRPVVVLPSEQDP
ncbi:SUMF1/EgtB/PvdO family nonheme iron enzyme [Acanthopleuribacter pedis]|uniref:SUMF1/EgtB/PvdO family nonheme iron enzyme n=1 Tax=Acanthopleuribacter pedis TaxID=442870 RepID=A0A8J7QCV4_9BACT|nr:SUMF1/EgtB/PvdO family nonheme iron enzyme [Acanthopleuribacter pedis]MBO1323401.1 SUMF1/EgtB/PvdO family nonheme iron enzyme [Acanthopleuribacter pedis]